MNIRVINRYDSFVFFLNKRYVTPKNIEKIILSIPHNISLVKIWANPHVTAKSSAPYGKLYIFLLFLNFISPYFCPNTIINVTNPVSQK